MITDTLKQVTKESHADLEKVMIRWIRTTRTREDYVRLLKLFYGFFKPVEERIDAHIDRGYLEDYESRRKADALLADMGGPQNSNIRLCDDIPSIAGTPASLGAMYVLEGSTLGGKIICKMLADNMGTDSPSSFAFFNSYGELTQPKWADFKNKLNNYTAEPGEQAEIIEAANDTFVKFKHWIQKHDQPQ